MTNPEPVVDDSTPDPAGQFTLEVAEQLAALQRGANWFYWIAGLSVVNSIIAVSGGAWNFIFGLGVTQVVDGIAAAAAQDLQGNAVVVVKGVAFVMSLLIAGTAALFGVFANRRHAWAFILGLLLYVLDGLLFLFFGDWLAVGFHVFAGYGIVTGYVALRKLRELQAQIPQPPAEAEWA